MKNDVSDIVCRNMMLVPFIINKMGLDFMYDDIVDLGWIGLIKGAQKYNPDKGLAESTVLCKYIKAHIHCYLNKKQLDTVSFDTEIIDEESFYDCIPSTFDVESEFRKNWIWVEIDKTLAFDMGNRRHGGINHADVICEMFGFGVEPLSFNELSKKYNVSRETLKNIRKKFRQKLRKRLKFILD